MIEKVVAWMFLVSVIVSMWALIYLAAKIGRMLRELRTLISANALGVQVAGAREARTEATLGRVEQVAVKAADDAATAAKEVAARVEQKVDEIKQVVAKGTSESHY